MFPSQAKTVIKKALDNPENTQPMFFWGPPGIGKSAIPREVCNEMHIGFVDMRLAQRDPTDLRGIPAVIDGKARWLPAPELPIQGQGILFLDELTSAPPLTQASAYQLTHDRKIGEYTLPKGYYIIAAGNRIEDRAVVYRMSTALANRFTHIQFEVSLDDWIAWAINANLEPNIIAFIRWKPDLLAPKFNPESSEKAFPTPRTWEFTSNLVKMFTNKKILAELIVGTIGEGAAAEFTAFLKVVTELPDLDTIFKGDNNVPKRTDLKYALVAALATRAAPAQYERMLIYSEFLPAEFNVLLITLLAKKNAQAMAGSPSWTTWAKAHDDIIVNRRKTT